MIRYRKPTGLICALLIMAACENGTDITPSRQSDIQTSQNSELCNSTQTLPALIQTVTERVMVQPPVLGADGTIIEPALFQIETRQEILRERQESRFETVCPALMTRELIASLQRALKARGHFFGAVSGIMSDATNRAVESFQTTLGLPTPVLAAETARRLGLIV
jgi:hypothetical protein